MKRAPSPLDEVQKRLDEMGARIGGVTWGPEAHKLHPRQLEADLAKFITAFLDGDCTPIEDIDDRPD